MSKSIRLVDNARLANQIAGLERRTVRGGRDTIDHPPSGRDDVANAVAGLATIAAAPPSIMELRGQFDSSRGATNSSDSGFSGPKGYFRAG